LKRAADPRFIRLVELVREGQLADTIQIRIEQRKEGPESSVIAFPPRKDPAASARRQEIMGLFGLKPNLQEFKVYSVQVPEADIAEGKAGPGAVSSGPEEPLSGPPMRILVGDAAPKDASVATQYNGRWFWIADTDIQSKSTFGIVMLLFSISETGIKGSPPVVTIPANQ
jgi:hypothetical protein